MSLWGFLDDFFGEFCLTKNNRILHHATMINIEGNSYRLREKVNAGLSREPEVEENEHGGGGLFFIAHKGSIFRAH